MKKGKQRPLRPPLILVSVAGYADAVGITRSAAYNRLSQAGSRSLGNGQAVISEASEYFPELASLIRHGRKGEYVFLTESGLNVDRFLTESVQRVDGNLTENPGVAQERRHSPALPDYTDDTESGLNVDGILNESGLTQDCSETVSISSTDTHLEVASSLLSLQPKNTTVRDIVAKSALIGPFLARLVIPDKKAIDQASSAGYVRLYRKLLHNGVFENPGVLKMMVALLLSADSSGKCRVCDSLLRLGDAEDEFRMASIMLAVLELEYGVIRLYREDDELMCEIIKWRNYQSPGNAGRSVFRDIRNPENVIRSIGENEGNSLTCAPDTTREIEIERKEKFPYGNTKKVLVDDDDLLGNIEDSKDVPPTVEPHETERAVAVNENTPKGDTDPTLYINKYNSAPETGEKYEPSSPLSVPIVSLISNKGVHKGKVEGYYDDLSDITGKGRSTPASELPPKRRKFILQANALYDIYRTRIGTNGSRKEVVKRAAILLEEYSYVEILEAIANYEGDISIIGTPIAPFSFIWHNHRQHKMI